MCIAILKHIFLACVITVALGSCSKVDPIYDEIVAENVFYTVHKENGVYTLHFKEEATPSFGNVPEVVPSYKTLYEMKKGILSGNMGDLGSWSVEALQQLQLKGGENKILTICDLENLLCPVLPEGGRIESVAWYGSTYSFQFSVDCEDHTATGRIMLYDDKASFEKQVLRNYTYWMTRGESLADRNAVLYENLSEDKNVATATVLYQSKINGRILYVSERYREVAESTKSASQNEYDIFEKGFEEPTIAVDAYPGIPNSIDVYVEGDLAYFHLRLKCNFIPSIEWLSSFGLTPYVEE